MPNTTPIQINLINPSFFLYAHSTSFAEPTASKEYVSSESVGETANATSLNLESIAAVITALEPGYSVLRPIPVKLERGAEAFLASFETANIYTSGETFVEAAKNLKSLILDIYDSLIAEDRDALGPGPKRQLATLLRYVKENHSQ